MSGDRVTAESEVSGNRTEIPSRIRRELDIDDGDRLRWSLEKGERVRIEVVHDARTFDEDFDGYDGDEDTNVTVDHDHLGLE